MTPSELSQARQAMIKRLNRLTDRELVLVLAQVYGVLSERHNPEEYEVEGLETLISAIDELIAIWGSEWAPEQIEGGPNDR